MKRLLSRNFWISTKTPRWSVVVGFMAAFALSFCSASYLQNKDRVYNNRAEQIRSLVDSMVEFQVFTTSFAYEMISDKKVKEETKKNLILNLNNQYAQLRLIKENIPKDSLPIADIYQKKILYMIEVVQKTKDMQSMKEFWSSVNDLIHARNNLNTELQKTI